MECIRRAETDGKARVIVQGRPPQEGGPDPRLWSADFNHALRRQQASLGYVVVADMVSYLSLRHVDLYGAMARYGLLSNHPWWQLPTYHLIEVPDGDVFRAMGAIFQAFTNPAMPSQFVTYAEPEAVLHLAAPLQPSRIGTNFTLLNPTSMHSKYKGDLNLGLASANGVDGTDSVVAILDTGAEQRTNPESWRDLTGVASAVEVDDNGHGTAMLMIAKDVAPGAKVHALRVTDAGRIYLWDLMAGVLAAAVDIGAHLVSMSLGVTDLNAKHCWQCGQGWSKSRTFQGLLDRIRAGAGRGGAPDPIFLAAVGNDGDPGGFLWPAAFGSTVAIGAVTHGRKRPDFSNTGTAKPARYFLCPGGDIDAAGTPIEWVGEGSVGATPTKCLGTSPATAYAAGVLALHRDYRRRAGLLLESGHILDNAFNKARPDVSNENGNVRLIYDR
jgi:hypothetical protein